MRHVEPGQVVGDDGRWAYSERNVDEHARGRRPYATQAARLMDELTDSLVTRPRQSEALGLSANTPVDLGNRNAGVVEADERFDETRRDPRCKRDHLPHCDGPPRMQT